MNIIAEGVELTWMDGMLEMHGDVEYLPEKSALILHPVNDSADDIDHCECDGFLPPPEEVLTVNLTESGLHPAAGCVFVRDYSHHAGLFAALAVAGVVESQAVRKVNVGTFGVPCFEARLRLG
jgi:hypothetical protein